MNRRLSYTVGDGQVTFTTAGRDIRVIPAELRELPPLRDFEDEAVLGALAGRFERQDFGAGEVIAEFGHHADRVYGQYFGEQVLTEAQGIWEFTAKAVTPCTVLSMSRRAFEELTAQSGELREHLDGLRNRPDRPQDEHGEAEIAVAAGHAGEPDLPGTFVDYEACPREYELSVAQTVLRVHSRVADLYNEPMNQIEQQLRLTVEALRERQEHELVNNAGFGLLHNADLSQQIHTRTGPPTPDDMDELLCRRRKTRFFLSASWKTWRSPVDPASPAIVAGSGFPWTGTGRDHVRGARCRLAPSSSTQVQVPRHPGAQVSSCGYSAIRGDLARLVKIFTKRFRGNAARLPACLADTHTVTA